MEKEIIDEFTADVQLIAGAGGIFDVVVDGQKLFSKKKIGRFPNPGEINKLIKKL